MLSILKQLLQLKCWSESSVEEKIYNSLFSIFLLCMPCMDQEWALAGTNHRAAKSCLCLCSYIRILQNVKTGLISDKNEAELFVEGFFSNVKLLKANIPHGKKKKYPNDFCRSK